MDMKEVVFDPDFYHNKYPDLQNAFHHDNAKLRTHWQNHGIKEGRACSDVLDLKFYVENHPDLVKAFGTDYTKAYEHYFRHGIKEMRQSSPTYNPKVYQAVYPFLANLTPCQLIWHFRNMGRPQGMIATMGFAAMAVPAMSGDIKDLIFDPDFYHNKYPDLQNAFHHDNAKLRTHWQNHGIKEGRACSDVLDLKFYVENHPDLVKAFGTDYTKAYEHYFRHGIKEMRQSSPTYNPKVYQAVYPFLANLTPCQLIWHFRNMGRPQGMIATMGFAAMAVPAMSGDIKDLIFDPDFYHNKYPDLQNAFHHDNAKLRTHWQNHGIKEGRACSDVLDLKFYVEHHPDLVKAFGNDYPRAYEHFFRHGIKEMRQSSPTYNPKVYQARYGLEGMDGVQLLNHFMTFGRTHYMWAY